MASRRKAREYTLQALYMVDQTGIPVRDALNGLWSGLLEEEAEGELGKRQADSQEIEFATGIAEGVVEHRDALDERIEASSTNWRIARMALVDRNILRMAAYEILHEDEIPVNVSINEAVELAKRFGTKDSRAFVNGILDRIARESRG
jgi:N utilization substance protein B